MKQKLVGHKLSSLALKIYENSENSYIEFNPIIASA